MKRAIGLMSGTSMDGVDVAMIETDGERRIVFGPTAFQPYSDTERNLLRAALEKAVELEDRTSRPAPLDRAETMVTERHSEAVLRFLADHDIDIRSVDTVGFHGQTVLHRPERGLTVQIGDGARLAERLGIAVVSDLRAADVAAGGQGAPLVPVFHHALVQASGLPRPALIINIGGVSNITFVTADADPIACDTGPGNALIDDLMLDRLGQPFDQNGETAIQGTVNEAALYTLSDHPYFDKPPPKSLDRNAFSMAAVRDLPTFDAAATLTAFTAVCIARSLDHLPQTPAVAVVCGGGAFNPALMDALRARLPCPVKAAGDVGWQADAIEAQAFAYLAVRARKGLPLTFPMTTGVGRPLTGGVFFPA